MMMILTMLVFAAAFSASAWVFAFTLAPAVPRIVALLRGEDDPASAPRPMLVISEDRVRARLSSAAIARSYPLREAA